MSRIHRAHRARPAELPDNVRHPGERLGKLTAWAPSSGQGIVNLANGKALRLDLFHADIVNNGYVDLFVGRPVSVHYSGGEVTTMRALGRPQDSGRDYEPISMPLRPEALWGTD